MATMDGDASALQAKVQELQAQLARSDLEKQHLTEELRRAKELNVAVQQQAEQEEEAITLKLMRRLEQLKKEKAVLKEKVEQEEEFLANNLQKRLEKLSLEKAQLDIKLGELKKQTEQLEVEKARLAKEKIDLEATLDSESEYIVNKLQVQLVKLANEKKHLHVEKAELQRQVAELGQSVERINRDKVRLEQEMEMEEESIVNRLQRQLELVLGSIRLIEAKLEAKGMTMKDLGITPFEFAAPETLRVYSRSPSSASSIDKWGHSPYTAQSVQLGSSPSAHAPSSALHHARSHHRAGGYARISGDMRVSGGGNSLPAAGPGAGGGGGSGGPHSGSLLGGSTGNNAVIGVVGGSSSTGAATAVAAAGSGGISGAGSMELCGTKASSGSIEVPAAKARGA